MRKFINILFVALILGFTSCEGFLDRAPLDKPRTDGDLNTEDALALINAAYQPLQWPKLYNMRIFSFSFHTTVSCLM